MAENEAFESGGGEEEGAGDAPLPALDPLAAALAARAAQANAALAGEAANYFRDQRRLVQITTEHLHEQREILLANLKLRRFTEILKAGVQLFLATVAANLVGRQHDAMQIFDASKTLSLCVALKGHALAGSGDLPAAKAVWAAGLAAAPDLPAIYYYRGLTESEQGDASGAIRDFQAAHASAPHWAEPLKAWGDLLGKQNYRQAAQAKYDEALEYAPHWKALQEAQRENEAAGPSNP